MSRNSMMARGWLTVTVVAVIALVIATKTGSANDSNGDGAKAETLVRMVSELRLKLRKLPEAERCETFTKNVVMQAREAHLIGDNDKRGDEENEWAHYKRIIELIQGRLGCFGRSSPSITSRLCSLVSFMNDCADYIRNPDFVEPQPAPSGEVKATGSIPDTESLQREILAMKSKNQELLERLSQNKQELLAKDELIQQVRDEMSVMKSKLDQTIAATKDQLSQTSEELKAKESVNQQINSELASLQSKLNEKDKELVAAKDVLVEQVRKEKAGQQQLKLDQTTSDQLKQASQELAAKDKRIEQLNSELARLQSKLDQKNGDHLMEKGRLAQQVRDEMNDVQLKLIKKIAATNQELTKKTEELSIKERLLKQAEFDKSQLQLQLANKISLNNANVSELKNCRTSLMEVDKLKRENYKLQRTIDEWIIVNKEQKKQLDLKKHELNQSLEGNRKCLNFMEELRLDYYMRTGREYNISSLLRYLQ